MNREYYFFGEVPPHPINPVPKEKRNQAGLPITAMDDIWTLAQRVDQGHDSLLKENKPLEIIVVIALRQAVQLTAIEEFISTDEVRLWLRFLGRPYVGLVDAETDGDIQTNSCVFESVTAFGDLAIQRHDTPNLHPVFQERPGQGRSPHPQDRRWTQKAASHLLHIQFSSLPPRFLVPSPSSRINTFPADFRQTICIVYKSMAKFTQSIANRIQEFLAGPEYRPLKQHELARALNIKGSDRALFRHTLYDLERQGLIACLRKNRWALPDGSRQLVGQLRFHAQGFGFVTPDTRGAEDVFIPAEDIGTALDGDKVVVTLTRSGRHRNSASGQQRPVGRIERVMERRHSQLVGILKKTAYYWYLIPDNPRIPHNVRVREFSKHIRKPEENHKAVIVLDPREQAYKPLSGIVIEDLGLSESPGVDMLSVLRSYKVEEEFSEKAMAEAERRSPALSAADLAGRRDLRELVTFTIDPEDAKDYDDAVSLSRTPDGLWLLGVHIADVPHFVRTGSRIDQEAFQRGNSVYLVDRVIPMLPRHLTTEICSLQPFVDRLTHTVNVLMDDDGHVHRSETFLSVIRSSARLNYDQVQSLFDNRPEHGIAPARARRACGHAPSRRRAPAQTHGGGVHRSDHAGSEMRARRGGQTDSDIQTRIQRSLSLDRGIHARGELRCGPAPAQGASAGYLPDSRAARRRSMVEDAG